MVKCYFECDAVPFYKVEAHWKSATLDLVGSFVGFFGFVLFFQVTVLNNLLNYFDFLN